MPWNKMVKLLFLLVIVAAILTLANATPTTTHEETEVVDETEDILKEANSGDSEIKANGIKRASEILDKTDDKKVFLENIEKFSSKEFLSSCVKCLEDKTKSVETRQNAAFVLASITAGKPEHKRAVYEAGALPVFINLLEPTDTDNINLRSYAIYGLQSLCVWDDVYSKDALDSVKNLEAVPRLVKILDSTKHGAVQELTVDTLFVLFEKMSPSNFGISLPEIFGKIKSDHFDLQVYVIRKAREILERTNPREVFLENVKKFSSKEFLPIFVNCLKDKNKKSIKARTNAAFVLASIAAGNPEHRDAVYEAGALSIFIDLLQSKHNDKDSIELCSFSILGLKNLCVEDFKYSNDALDSVKVAKVVHRIEEILRSTKEGNALRISVDTLFVLFEKMSPPNFDFSWLHSSKIKNIKISGQNMNVQAYGIRKAREILENPDPKEVFHQNIEKFIAAKLLPIFIKCLKNTKNSVEARKDALCALANITCGDQKDKRAVYEAKALPIFINLLKSSDTDNELYKYFLIGLNNLCAGDEKYSKNALDMVNNENAVQRLVKMLESSKDQSVLGNTVGILCSLIEKVPKSKFKISSLDSAKIQVMVENGAIKTFCALLPNQSEPFRSNVFAGIKNALDRQKSESNGIKDEINECLGKIENSNSEFAEQLKQIVTEFDKRKKDNKKNGSGDTN